MLALRRLAALTQLRTELASLASSRSASVAAASAVADASGDEAASSASAAAALVSDPTHRAKLQAVLERPFHPAASADESSASEREMALDLFRLHNTSMRFAGHMIQARVVEVDKRKITLDAGAKIAKIAVADITPECILSQAPALEGDPPRDPGEVRPGDVVQVFLEYEETPEGDMMVTGQHAAVRNRVAAVWKELETRLKAGTPVLGRVLNSVAGGFAVGVAGLVCFLPNSTSAHATTSRIGELQEFRIMTMNPARNNVVLADLRLDADVRRAMAGQDPRRGQHGQYGQQQQQRYQRPRQPPRPKPPRPMMAAAAEMSRELDQATPKSKAPPAPPGGETVA